MEVTARLDIVKAAAADEDMAPLVDSVLRSLLGTAYVPVSKEVLDAHLETLRKRIESGDKGARHEALQLILLAHQVLVKYVEMAREQL